jgi:hypothetical protein
MRDEAARGGRCAHRPAGTRPRPHAAQLVPGAVSRVDQPRAASSVPPKKTQRAGVEALIGWLAARRSCALAQLQRPGGRGPRPGAQGELARRDHPPDQPVLRQLLQRRHAPARGARSLPLRGLAGTCARSRYRDHDGRARPAPQFRGAPETAEALLEEAVASSEIPDEAALTDYFHALLLDVNGWASWVAYLRWQANLAGGEDAMPQLLAVRLAWELVLWRHVRARNPRAELLPPVAAAVRASARRCWSATASAATGLDLAACRGNRLSGCAARAAARSRADAECASWSSCAAGGAVHRRALRGFPARPGGAEIRRIQTLGFAGFFGLPIAYAPAGASYERPQLPGLLSPAITVSEVRRRRRGVRPAPKRLNRAARWSAVGRAAPASFGYVESVGIGYAFKLLRESVSAARRSTRSTAPACEHSALRRCAGDDGVLDAAAQAGSRRVSSAP